MTNEELTLYYTNLLIMQYANRSRAVATVGAFVEEVVASQIIEQVSDGFDLETAIGDQLTIIGTYRNAPRMIFGLTILKDFFATVPYDEPDPSTFKGFSTYDNPVPAWYFLLYTDVNQLIYQLTDSELRTVIQYLAELNSSDYGLGSLDAILFKYFGTYVTLTDNEDMTITYEDAVDDPSDLFAIVNALGKLPRPSGVDAVVI